MSSTVMKQRVLSILADRVLHSAYPDLTDITYLAEQLQLSLKDTRTLLKSMEGSGVIESSVDCDYALITRNGLEQADQYV